VCDVHAYQRGFTVDGETCHVVGGGPVPVRVARNLFESAFVKLITHDGVRIDSVCHLGRYKKAELRTALELGDPPEFNGVTCSELGCGRRYGLQWDHLDPVANNGPTSRTNLDPK
jgi:hypothetical protein